MKKITLVLFILLLFFQLSFSTILVNSEDGRDVVIGAYYAAVLNDNAYFIPSQSTIEMILSKLKPADKEEIILIEGKNRVMPELKALLQSRGYTIKETIISQDPYETNIEVSKKLGEKIKGYIIVSPSIGYNSVSPIPFARHKNYYLLFDAPPIRDEIIKITKGKNILVYGFIDENLKDSLEGNIEVIDNGDKYSDNIEIVKKTLSIFPTKQLIITDGNFLEYSIMNSDYPILFISSIIPKQVKDFVKEYAEKGRIKALLLIGQEYINTAYDLKNKINKEVVGNQLSVFAKLGETYPSVSPNLFPFAIFVLPAPYASIEVVSSTYNKATNNLEVLFENKGNSKGYYTYSIKVFGNNKTIASFGGEGIEELAPNEKKSLEFNLSLDKDFEGILNLEASIIFGTSKSLLDQAYVFRKKLATIEFIDNSNLSILEARYIRDKSLITVKIKNNGGEKVYYKTKIIYKEGSDNVEINDELRTIEGKKTEVLRYNGIDIKSDEIRIEIYYGAKDYKLVKMVEAKVLVENNQMFYIGIALLVFAVVVIVFIAIKKMKNKG